MIPIFIGGCPRSGTTLLGSMLGGHDQVVCLPESPFIGSLATSLTRDAPSQTSIAELHKEIRADFKFAFWTLDTADLRACAAVPTTSYSDVINAYVGRFADRRGRSSPSHWVDHSPTNLMYSARLSAAFVDARFVHIVRDGRAVCNSWIPLDWGPNTIISSAWAWVANVGHGLAAEVALPAAKIRRVSYEELVADPERALKELCAWLDLPYQASMLAGKGFEVPVYTRNQHSLNGQPVSSERIDRWRSALTVREVEIFEAITGDLLVNLGYELATSGGGAELSNLEKIRMELVDKARKLTHFATRPVRLRRFLNSMKREDKGRKYATEKAAGL